MPSSFLADTVSCRAPSGHVGSTPIVVLCHLGKRRGPRTVGLAVLWRQQRLEGGGIPTASLRVERKGLIQSVEKHQGHHMVGPLPPRCIWRCAREKKRLMRPAAVQTQNESNGREPASHHRSTFSTRVPIHGRQSQRPAATFFRRPSSFGLGSQR